MSFIFWFFQSSIIPKHSLTQFIYYLTQWPTSRKNFSDWTGLTFPSRDTNFSQQLSLWQDNRSVINANRTRASRPRLDSAHDLGFQDDESEPHNECFRLVKCHRWKRVGVSHNDLPRRALKPNRDVDDHQHCTFPQKAIPSEDMGENGGNEGKTLFQQKSIHDFPALNEFAVDRNWVASLCVPTSFLKIITFRVEEAKIGKGLWQEASWTWSD